MKPMHNDIEKFFEEPTWTFEYNNIPDLPKEELIDWVITQSGWPYLKIELPNCPYEEMLEEALSMYDAFQTHRTYGDNTKGWRSICIYGEAWNRTEYWETYEDNKGKQLEDIKFDWCPEVIEHCPITYKYFKDTYPENPGQRIRFMLLEPGGYIEPHNDRTEHYLGTINITLNMPEGCIFRMKDKCDVPITVHNTFLVNICNLHSVWNNSKEPRVHIISHGGFKPEVRELIYETVQNMLDK